jgi:hypothetical protein
MHSNLHKKNFILAKSGCYSFPRPACRPMPPPGLRPVARPSWPTREVVSLLATQPPPSSAPSHHRVKPPWLPQPSPRPPLFMADRYPSLIPTLIAIYSRYSSPPPPLNPHRAAVPEFLARCSAPLSSPGPNKRRAPSPSFTTPPQLTPPSPEARAPRSPTFSPQLIPHRRPTATLLPAPR